MKLRYISDLHLEFLKQHKVDNQIKQIQSGLDEICILAGDIGNPFKQHYDMFMKFVSKNFKKVFVIAGNHEYYNDSHTIDQTTAHLESYFQQFKNVTFLNNSFEHYDNRCFVGSTLWSYISNPRVEINDVYSIPELNYQKYNSLHKESMEFLGNTIKENTDCVVITHHAPSMALIHPKYKTLRMSPYNQWFASDILDTIPTDDQKNIVCWIYGHTHTPSEMVINDIPFLCNPIGYPSENTKINFNATFIP
jgi:predicted phosphodiesterase